VRHYWLSSTYSPLQTCFKASSEGIHRPRRYFSSLTIVTSVKEVVLLLPLVCLSVCTRNGWTEWHPFWICIIIYCVLLIFVYIRCCWCWRKWTYVLYTSFRISLHLRKHLLQILILTVQCKIAVQHFKDNRVHAIQQSPRPYRGLRPSTQLGDFCSPDPWAIAPNRGVYPP